MSETEAEQAFLNNVPDILERVLDGNTTQASCGKHTIKEWSGSVILSRSVALHVLYKLRRERISE